MPIPELNDVVSAVVPTHEITGRQIVVLSILVLYLGKLMTNRVSFLVRNNIPASVTGGLICSIIIALLSGFGIVELTFNLDLRNLLLLFFFSTIGLTAKFSALAKGGKALFILVITCAVFLVVQNIVGVSAAAAYGKIPIFGLFGGSIPLAGGHGTAVAWGEVASSKGLIGASEFGIASATFGLILGGFLGGPIAARLIRKHGLTPNNDYNIEVNTIAEPVKTHVTIEDVIGTILALGLCLGLGDAVNHYLFSYEIRLPGFLTAMLSGIVITNLADPLKIKLKPIAIDLIGGVSLQLFLVMSLMSMDLLSLADSAILLVVTMTIQSIVITFFAIHIIFRLMGKDYDAAVITGGFVGIGLGATPVGIANMAAVSDEHGPSVKALLIVPLVGGFFIDLINALTIETFLRMPFLR